MDMPVQAKWSANASNAAILAARILLAWVFLDSGVAKLLHWQDGIAEVAGLGLGNPQLMLILTVVTQIVGGLAVVFGFGTRLAALALAGFTLVATVLAHHYWDLGGAVQIRQKITFLEHMAIVGGFVLLMVHGPGAWSLSAALLKKSRH
jgi:putative oxidoreductase